MKLLDKILRTFGLSPAPISTAAQAGDETQIAVAALLVEAARADENYSDEEVGLIDRALAAAYGLSAHNAGELRRRAETAQTEAADLYQFTRSAKALPHAEKIRLVETLWRIVLSDRSRDQYEDALIRRVCGLIYVEDRESGEARQRVQAETG